MQILVDLREIANTIVQYIFHAMIVVYIFNDNAHLPYTKMYERFLKQTFTKNQKHVKSDLYFSFSLMMYFSNV